jgi:hypothetical protein
LTSLMHRLFVIDATEFSASLRPSEILHASLLSRLSPLA